MSECKPTPAIAVRVNNEKVLLTETCTVLNALAKTSQFATRTGMRGRRGPCCGMGVCQECRVRINGKLALACLSFCRDGMEIVTEMQGPVDERCG